MLQSLIFAVLNRLARQNAKMFFILTIALSILVLITAFAVEYAGFKPCPLCIYARFPYAGGIIFSICALFIKRYTKILLLFIMLIQLASVALAAYHSSIEFGILPPLELCSKKIDYSALSLAQMRDSISDSMPDCSKPAILIFGLSMAAWNFVLNIILLLISALTLKTYICQDRILDPKKTT
jgi:disulfide bond formation protein DsbB